jgi:hypothetical protein
MRQKKEGTMRQARVPWPVILTMVAFVANTQAETIRNDLISVTIDQGRYAMQAQGRDTPFASGALRYEGAVKVVAVKDAVFGAGRAIKVTAANGSGESFEIFPGLPFVLQRRNGGHGFEQGAADECGSGIGQARRPVGGPWHRRS